MDGIFEDIDDKAPQVFVDGVTVHSHRLLGKPPSNPAYICNWDFDIGLITGEVKIPFLQAINSALDSFKYNLVDVENALPEISPPDRDITFLRLNAAGASVRIPVDTEEIRIQLGPTTIGADDRTSLLRSSKATISVQSFVIQIVHIDEKETVVAAFSTAIRLTMLARRQDLLDHGPKQAKHVSENDEPSRRAWFLYSKKRGHAREDLDTFEIDLPSLAAERVATIHTQTYTPKCTFSRSGHEEQEVHLASSFLAPEYHLSEVERYPRRPASPEFKERTPLLHSSYGDVVLTHVDSLPTAQITFIIELSVDTTLSVTPDVLHCLAVLFQALETTVVQFWRC